VPGVGWVEYGPDEALLPGQHARTGATPKRSPPDGSRHLLATPGGAARFEFTWLAAHRAWSRAGGIRHAFTAEYLGSHGWTYVGPVRSKG